MLASWHKRDVYIEEVVLDESQESDALRKALGGIEDQAEALAKKVRPARARLSHRVCLSIDGEGAVRRAPMPGPTVEPRHAPLGVAINKLSLPTVCMTS